MLLQGCTSGRDIKNETTIGAQGGALIGNTSIDRMAGVYVRSLGSTLFASAGRDVNLSGGIIADQGAGSHTSVKAKNGIDASTLLEGLAYGRVSLPVAFGFKDSSHGGDCLSKMVTEKMRLEFYWCISDAYKDGILRPACKCADPIDELDEIVANYLMDDSGLLVRILFSG